MSYIAECSWLVQHGIIRDVWQYERLPVIILEDCRILMRAQEVKEKSGGSPPVMERR